MNLRGTWPFWLGVVGLFLFTAWLFAMLGHAKAHEDAAWIGEQGLADPISHHLCCGVADCERMRPEDVRVVPGGYLIIPTGEVIPEVRALESIDGEFWRCRYLSGELEGKTRCFFRGLPGS